jgi:SOS regulatory protein LexA
MIDIYKNKIISFYKNHKRMPGYSEIMSLTGFKSKNAVYKLINKLVDMNILNKDAGGKITLVNTFDQIPFLGLVEAGLPSEAEEDILDMINVDEYLIENKDNTYMLEVKGDSMIEEGIKEGDMVIAEKRNNAKDGQIVIAEIDGGFTMKYFKKDGNKVYLKPANKNYKNIYPTQSLNIVAVVTGVVRKY